MSGVRVTWKPAPMKAARYDVCNPNDVVISLTNADFDEASGLFYYDDINGTIYTVYRVKGYASSGVLLSDTGTFQISQATGTDLTAKVKIDHNYLIADNYRYIASGGAGVPNATIRCYKLTDWQAGLKAAALFITETGDDGRWISPFFLDPGLTYVLEFSKEGSFGPDVVQVSP